LATQSRDKWLGGAADYRTANNRAVDPAAEVLGVTATRLVAADPRRPRDVPKELAMTKKILMLVVAVLALVVTIGSASAGKGGNSAPSSGSSIAIASINGGLLSASSGSQTAKLGDTLAFATTVERLAGNEYPMVALTCYQDVNHDGTVNTSITGPDIVFGLLDQPGATFQLGGWSPWTVTYGGGAATCRADLDAYGWKGGQESIRVLATTGDFAVSG
jgi:hypothetical protein